MDNLRTSLKKPSALSLEIGEYKWCRCGKSADQPFCDGSHSGSEFKPLRFEVTEKRIRSYCNCKQTSTAPYCDGTHKGLQ